ncbi:ABC transporter substrate-binding protein [Streptomyces sp. NPDC050625]|uniref:ABC transporter substrate-binding protein n=1 Tax=Streptomyces sp. NPDC050625 TaxID=3154629 RepID=UPI00341346AD
MSAPLRFVFGGQYDRVADLPAVAATMGRDIENHIVASPKDAFALLSSGEEGYAGGELSSSFYMTMRSKLGDDCPLVGLPVWISRSFRHSNVWVREDSDIESPADLAGKTVALPEYGMTMAVWLRGLFHDEYGVRPQDISWITHRTPVGLDEATLKLPQDVNITPAPDARSLPDLLRDGVADAWIGAGTYPPPRGIRRLFRDAPGAERDYFARTGIFPVMHTLVVRREVLEGQPELAQQLVDAFEATKRQAEKRLWSTSVSYPTLPWTLAAVEEQYAAMGGDPWPYGLERNRPTTDALGRYLVDQDLVWADLPIENYFLPLEPTTHKEQS